MDDAQITQQEVTLFKSILNLEKDEYILDIACGQGRHLIELTNHGSYQLFGLDRSQYLVQRARTSAKNKDLSIHIKEGDARKLPYDTDFFDVVTILGNSFGYFEVIEEDEKILEEVLRVLKPEGRLLMDVTDGIFLKENFTPRSWEWIDKKHFVCRERSLTQDGTRLISREVVTNTEKGIIVDQFYAERFYSKDMLYKMLTRVGFKNIMFHGDLEVDSERNQDLGMMIKRFILTASTKKELSSKKTHQSKKNVIVLMGDPSLNDVVKPSSKFDSDDFKAIEKLRITLSQLANYQVTYLNHYHSLISDLQKLQGKTNLVLNLCDEGYQNEAQKELHIPALLEMLGIPYTGSNPQTLAHCYDKSLVRGIANELAVPIADAIILQAGETKPSELNLSFPLIVKPNYGMVVLASLKKALLITQQNCWM